MTASEAETQKIDARSKHHLLETIKDAAASVIGSCACVYTGQPFDTVKVRMQVALNGPQGAISCLHRSIVDEGVLALWKGSIPACVGAVAENAMAFSTNGILKRLLDPVIGAYHDERDDGIRIKGPLLTGALTGALTAVVLTPCDIIKCRAQVSVAHGLPQPTASQLVATVLRTRGLRGFYTGFAAQVMREVPFFSAFFGSYEILGQALRRHSTLGDGAIYVVSGGLAGQIAWAASIAPDSIKTVIQTSEMPQSIRDTARAIYRTKGFRGFFAGLGVALVRAFPANAALFVGYEYAKAGLSAL